MFGFLPAPCGCFSTDERSAYRAHFCGLCNALRHRYGLWTRMLVNRDAAFLSLLGSTLSPSPPALEMATCCNPLGRPRALAQDTPQAHYAAAVTVCALSVKLRDDADDEAGWRGAISGVAHEGMSGALSRAVEVLQSSRFPTGEVLELMSSQPELEAVGDCGLEAAARPTRLAYGHLFAHLPAVTNTSASQEPALRTLGQNLGELIYLADAWDDHAEDRRRGRFNPLPDDPAERRTQVASVAGRCLVDVSEAFGALRLQGFLPLTRHLLLQTMPASVGQRFQMRLPPLLAPALADRSKRKDTRQKRGISSWLGCDRCDCCDGCGGCGDCGGCDADCCSCSECCECSCDHCSCCEGCHGCDGACCDGCDGCACH